MARYIELDALIAEINELKKEVGDDEYWHGYDIALDEVLYFIDTLEVKEVDLMMHTIIAEGCDWLALHTKLNHEEIEDCRNLMLTIKDEQLKAQKGE